MLDGLRYVVAQIALIVSVAALLAGVLGWILGRASGKRRATKTAAASPASRLMSPAALATRAYSPRHGMDVPVPVTEELVAPVAPSLIQHVPGPLEVPVVVEAPNPQDNEPAVPEEAVVEPEAEHLEPVAAYTLSPPDADAGSADEPDDDPDRTVLRPAPGMASPTRTPQYAPPRFTVVASTLGESELTVGRTASVQEVQELRREVRAKELELGKLEAGALSAWDRTVPALETQVSDLLDENASLRRQLREAEEHSEADAQTVERLRSLVAERDARLAEIRAQS